MKILYEGNIYDASYGDIVLEYVVQLPKDHDDNFSNQEDTIRTYNPTDSYYRDLARFGNAPWEEGEIVGYALVINGNTLIEDTNKDMITEIIFNIGISMARGDKFIVIKINEENKKVGLINTQSFLESIVITTFEQIKRAKTE